MSKGLNIHDATGVIAQAPGVGTLLAFGTTVPSDGAAGFAKGCIFAKTDGSTNAILYVNAGSITSADFNALPNAGVGAGAALTAQLTTLTPADAEGTPDYAIAGLTNSSPYGFVAAQEGITVLYVIKNLQVRLAEVEARLEAAGIVTAN
jgi:hypothetical protein